MTTITEIKIYWDVQDPANEGWAYRAAGDRGLIDSGPIEGIDADDLDGAIDDACSQLGVDLTADQFGRETHVDGGVAVWSA